MKTALINIGNTHTVVTDMNLIVLQTFKTVNEEEIFASLQNTENLVIASVVPELSEKIRKKMSDKNCQFISSENVQGLQFPKSDSATLGADRVANCLAAKELYGDSLVLDCGTCITAELIWQNEFLGGLIMPGRNIQRAAIHLYTAQLPHIPLQNKVLDIGKNTHEALAVGLDTVSLKGLHSWIEQAILTNYSLTICFTGGDSTFFQQGAKFPSVQNKNLTLLGLKFFAEQLEIFEN